MTQPTNLGIQVAPPPSTGAETESALRADRAWGHFAHTLARKVPRHVIGIRDAGRGFRRLQKPIHGRR